MSKKTDQLLKMANNFEKLAFNKKADISDVFRLLDNNYDSTAELLEDIAQVQLYLLTGGNELDSLNKEDEMYKNAEKVAQVIRSIIPEVKRIEEEGA